MDDIVMPFESSEMFFIDGAAVRAMDIFKL
jgi:hypothetical protein